MRVTTRSLLLRRAWSGAGPRPCSERPAASSRPLTDAKPWIKPQRVDDTSLKDTSLKTVREASDGGDQRQES